MRARLSQQETGSLPGHKKVAAGLREDGPAAG